MSDAIPLEDMPNEAGGKQDTDLTSVNEDTNPAVIPGEVSAESEDALKDKKAEPKDEDKGEELKAKDKKEEELPEDKWYEPGRYKTVDDAIKNMDKRLGKLGTLEKTINEIKSFVEGVKTAPKVEKEEVVNPQDINPDTGKPFTKAEIAQQWNDLYLENPVEAQQRWDAMREKQDEKKIDGLRAKIKQEIMQEMTWGAFLSSNPEIKDPETMKLFESVFQSFPKLNDDPQGLIKAKEITLSDGEGVEEKFVNWMISKRKNGDNPDKKKEKTEIAPAPPGQGIVNKGGGKEPKDGWSVWGIGSSLR